MNEAMFWGGIGNGAVNCVLCPHRCKIPGGSAGFCGVRRNIGGTLYAESYGKNSVIALDPIEKKPLYMFHPGKHVLSIGGYGCNLRCPFCQNSDISMEYEKTWQAAEILAPEDIAALAVGTLPRGNIGAAYTYNEPLIGYEFVRDCAGLVREAGLCNVLVTNGYVNPEPLEALLPLIGAMNIDLKGFTEGFYKRLGGNLEAVKETIALARQHCHVEIAALIIPGENDSEDEIMGLARWVASLDPEIPLHLTRFFPRYQYAGRAATPRETVWRLRDAAGRYLKNVFAGNMRQPRKGCLPLFELNLPHIF